MEIEDEDAAAAIEHENRSPAKVTPLLVGLLGYVCVRHRWWYPKASFVCSYLKTGPFLFLARIEWILVGI
jgi:hypothetical protein